VVLGCVAAERLALEWACIDRETGLPEWGPRVGGAMAEPAELRGVSDALRRLLAGFGVGADARMEAMIEDWSRRAFVAWRERPEADLVDIALAEAEADLNRWFDSVLGSELIADQPPARVGRAAYLLCGAGHRWPECFLSHEALPDHVTGALRNAVPPATPPAQPSPMPEQALESWTLIDLLGALPRAGLRILLGRTAAATQ
jgi:hypothetical protein